MRTAFAYEIDLFWRHGISGRHGAVKQLKHVLKSIYNALIFNKLNL